MTIKIRVKEIQNNLIPILRQLFKPSSCRRSDTYHSSICPGG